MHVALEVALLVDDFHRAPAEDIGRTHDQRIPDFRRRGDRGFLGACRAVRRLHEVQPVQELLETLAVFRHVDHVG